MTSEVIPRFSNSRDLLKTAVFPADAHKVTKSCGIVLEYLRIFTLCLFKAGIPANIAIGMFNKFMPPHDKSKSKADKFLDLFPKMIIPGKKNAAIAASYAG